jgi:hypothetical protein
MSYAGKRDGNQVGNDITRVDFKFQSRTSPLVKEEHLQSLRSAEMEMVPAAEENGAHPMPQAENWSPLFVLLSHFNFFNKGSRKLSRKFTDTNIETAFRTVTNILESKTSTLMAFI